MKHFNRRSHPPELFFAHDGLEYTLQVLYFGSEYLLLPSKDGHIFIIETHIVIFHEGLKLVLFLLSALLGHCGQDRVLASPLHLLHLFLQLVQRLNMVLQLFLQFPVILRRYLTFHRLPLPLPVLQRPVEILIIPKGVILLLSDLQDVLLVTVHPLSENIAPQPVLALLNSFQRLHEPLLQFLLLALQFLLQAELTLLAGGQLVQLSLHLLVFSQVVLVVCQFVQLRLVQVEPTEQVGLDGDVALKTVTIDFTLVSDSPIDALVLILLLNLLPSQQFPGCLVGSKIRIVLQQVQIPIFQLLLRKLPMLVLDYFCELVVILGLLAVHQLLMLRTAQNEDSGRHTKFDIIEGGQFFVCSHREALFIDKSAMR